jgi:hypothetical protein
MENLENEIATINTNEVFVTKEKPTTKTKEYTSFELEVIHASSIYPVDRVCALFGINANELADILQKAPNNYKKPCSSC